MTLPPTLSRELRATARRRSTNWGRALLATFAVMSCLFVFDYQSLAMSPAGVGRILFTLVASIGACFAVLASLFTADSISSERRQGTLGLLFLTDQTAVDVILGKPAVHGFASLYLLLGLMPALMLSLVAGGFTYGEVLRDSHRCIHRHEPGTHAISLDQLWPSAAGLLGIAFNLGFLRWAGDRLRRDFRAHDRSRFDRFFDWCDGWLSGNLKRT